MTNINDNLNKRVSIKLLIGIILFPVFFVWFLCRKGHSTISRVLGFSWAALPFVAAILTSDPAQTITPKQANSEASETPAGNTKSYGPLGPVPEGNQGEFIKKHLVDVYVGAYEANEVRADNQYSGKRFFVVGRVDSVSKDILGDSYVILNGENQNTFRQFQAYFHKLHKNKLAGLNPGDVIALDCKIRGLMMNVQGGDCFVSRGANSNG